MLGAIVGLLFFQPPDLIKQIERLAASEPAAYGIDTRIRAAEVLSSKYPHIVQQELSDAEASLPGVSDADYRDVLRVRIAGLLAGMDFTEAERVAKTISPERKHDRLAQAYDELYRKAGKRNRFELLLSVFDSGAFRLEAATENIPSEQAMRLFGAIVRAFPADSPELADIDYLLNRTEQFIKVNRELVLAAIQKAVAAAEAQPAQTRSAIRAQAAGLLRQIGSKPPDDLQALLDEPRPPKEKPAPKSAEEDHDFSKLPYAEALEKSLKLEDPSDRAGNLIELSRREDLTSKQQARVASEALSAVNGMPLSDERLMGLSMLSRDFAKRSEMANASLAARMLSETYDKVCACGGPLCETNGHKFECVTLVNDYAQYLDELNFSQESLGLNNISLEARLLIFKLHKSIAAAK